MKHSLSLFFLLAISQLSLSQDFTINATITGFPDGTKFYLDEVHTQQTIAASTIRDDKLKIQGSFNEYPTMVALKAILDNNAYVCFILMGNENVNIEGDIKDFPFDVKVSGSKYQDENEMLKKQTRLYDKQRDSISRNLFELIKDTSAEGGKKLYAIAKQQAYYDHITDSVTIHFIKSHLNSYAAINQLYYLRKKFSKDTVEIMYNSLPDELKESIFGRKIFTYLKIGNILKVGDAASNFEAQDAVGNKHQLSELQGKWILIDFTETFCLPCVLAVAELKEVSKKYADKLAIISFCADRQKDIWLKGITRDRPGWLCLWDGKGPASETPLKYGVNGYPGFVLISPAGKILDRLSGFSNGDLLKLISKHIGPD